MKTAGVCAALLISGVCLVLGGCEDGWNEPEGIIPADLSYCGAVSNWESPWESLEWLVLDAINEQRGRTTDCGEYGVFPPVPPLEFNDLLRCTARAHSQDMAESDYFDHVGPAGDLPWDRMDDAGYDYYAAGENIAAGFSLGADVVAAWVESDGHCANLMGSAYVETGVGYYYDQDSTYRYYWTQSFASPAEEDSSARMLETDGREGLLGLE